MGGAIRTGFAILLVFLCVANACCAFLSRKSDKSISLGISMLSASVVLPMLGNLILIIAQDYTLAMVGSYVYFLGLNAVVVALLFFTADYCSVNFRGTRYRTFVIVLITVDTVQLLANAFTKHAFDLSETIVDGAPYFSLVPYAGQAFHRVIAYGIFFASLAVFVYKVVKSPRIYVERYAVILAAMLFTGLLETFFIFTNTSIDFSMAAFGLFGLLVYYFAIHYKPVRLLDRMLSSIVDDMGDGVVFFDHDGACIYANDHARDMLDIRSERDLEHAASLIGSKVGPVRSSQARPWDERITVKKEGAVSFWTLSARDMYDERTKRPSGSYVVLRDSTDLELKLERERYAATHDDLTDLYNKQHLYNKARELIDANPNTRFAAVAVDIKGFKIINDIFGKDFGDKVLCVIAEYLRTKAVDKDVYGRISGDKFGFIMPVEDLARIDFDEMLDNQKAAMAELNQPIVVHVGVYEVTEPDLLVSIMFDRAFMAIASIKNDYQRHVAYYDDAMRENAIWSQRISSELDFAIADGQIVPYLQPLVDAAGNIMGAEVLVRWIHPEEGFLSPGRFIPIFETNGMISKLDVHMWESACRILKSWQERGIDHFLSVNISPRDFYFIDVYKTIRELVDEYGIDASKLRLEITETVMMNDISNRLKIIDALRADGFLVEMDDFGSGYSSLNMLKDIPVDVLKIDMIFLYQTKDIDRAHTILQMIINLSEQLGIPAVTEDVETRDQHEMLVDMGCHLFQGYYFAKPMPLVEFEQLYVNAN